jgi:hypothetical protein
MVALTAGPVMIGSVTLDVNALVYACTATVVGIQLVLSGGIAEIYGWHEGIAQDHHVARWTRLLRLERLAALGLGLMLLGAIGTLAALRQWSAVDFAGLDPRGTIRIVLVSSTAIGVGTLCIFTGLLSSLLTLRSTRLHFDDDSDDASPSPLRAARS